MVRKKDVAIALGITEKTLRSNEAKGFVLVKQASGKIDLTQSVHAYVKFQSERIRILQRLQVQNQTGSSGNSDEEGLEFWKTEKEKQHAIKLKRENDREFGVLIPTAALLELITSTMCFVKTRLLGVSGKAQKQHTFSVEQLAVIDELTMDALQGLNADAEQLSALIADTLRRYAQDYRATDEGEDNSVGDPVPES